MSSTTRPLTFSDDEDIDDQERENEVIRILQRGISDSSAEQQHLLHQLQPPPMIHSNVFSSRSTSDGDIFVVHRDVSTRSLAVEALQESSCSGKKRKASTRTKNKKRSKSRREDSEGMKRYEGRKSVVNCEEDCVGLEGVEVDCNGSNISNVSSSCSEGSSSPMASDSELEVLKDEDASGEVDAQQEENNNEDEDNVSVCSSHSETSLVLRKAEALSSSTSSKRPPAIHPASMMFLERSEDTMSGPPSPTAAALTSSASKAVSTSIAATIQDYFSDQQGMPPPSQLPTTKLSRSLLPPPPSATSNTLLSMGMIRPPVSLTSEGTSSSSLSQTQSTTDSLSSVSTFGQEHHNKSSRYNNSNNPLSISFSVDGSSDDAFMHTSAAILLNNNTENTEKSSSRGLMQRQVAVKKLNASALSGVSTTTSAMNVSFATSSQRYPPYAGEQVSNQAVVMMSTTQPYPKPVGISVNTTLANSLAEQHRLRQQGLQPQSHEGHLSQSLKSSIGGTTHSTVVVTPLHSLSTTSSLTTEGLSSSSMTPHHLQQVLRVVDLTEEQVHYLLWQYYSGYTPNSGNTAAASSTNGHQYRVTGADLVYVEDIDDLKELGFESLPKVKLRRIVQDLKIWKSELDGIIPPQIAALLIPIGRAAAVAAAAATEVVPSGVEVKEIKKRPALTITSVNENEENDSEEEDEDDHVPARGTMLRKQSGERRNFSAVLQQQGPSSQSSSNKSLLSFPSPLGSERDETNDMDVDDQVELEQEQNEGTEEQEVNVQESSIPRLHEMLATLPQKQRNPSLTRRKEENSTPRVVDSSSSPSLTSTSGEMTTELSEKDCLYICQMKLSQETAALASLSMGKISSGALSNSFSDNCALASMAGSPSTLSMMLHLLTQYPAYSLLCRLLTDYLLRELPVQKGNFFFTLETLIQQANGGVPISTMETSNGGEMQYVPKPYQVSQVLFAQLYHHVVVSTAAQTATLTEKQLKGKELLIVILLKCLRLLWSIFDSEMLALSAVESNNIKAIEALVALVDVDRYPYHSSTEIMFHYSGFMKLWSCKKVCRDALFFATTAPAVSAATTSYPFVSTYHTGYARKLIRALRLHYVSSENLVKCYTACIRYFASQDSLIQQVFGEGRSDDDEETEESGLCAVLVDMLRAYKPTMMSLCNYSDGSNSANSSNSSGITAVNASTSMIVTLKQIFSLIWTISLYPANKIFMFQYGMCEVLVEYLAMIYQDKPLLACNISSSSNASGSSITGIVSLMLVSQSAALQLLHPLMGSIWTLIVFPSNRDCFNRLGICEWLVALLRKTITLTHKNRAMRNNDQRSSLKQRKQRDGAEEADHDHSQQETEAILVMLIDQLCGIVGTLAELGDHYHKKLNVFGVCELLVEVLQCYCCGDAKTSSGKGASNASHNVVIAESACKAIAAMIDGEKGEVTIFSRDCLLGTTTNAISNSGSSAGLSCFDLLLNVFQCYLPPLTTQQQSDCNKSAEVIRQVCFALRAILIMKAKASLNISIPAPTGENTEKVKDGSGNNKVKSWQQLNLLLLQGIKLYTMNPVVLLPLLSVLQVSSSIPASCASSLNQSGSTNRSGLKLTAAILGLCCESTDDSSAVVGDLGSRNNSLVPMMEVLQQLLEFYSTAHTQGENARQTECNRNSNSMMTNVIEIITSLCETIANITTALSSNGGSDSGNNATMISLASLSSSSSDSLSVMLASSRVGDSSRSSSQQQIRSISTVVKAFAGHAASIALQSILPVYKREDSLVLSITRLLKLTGLPSPSSMTLASLSSTSLASISTLTSASSLASRSSGSGRSTNNKNTKSGKSQIHSRGGGGNEGNNTTSVFYRYYYHSLSLLLDVMKTFKHQVPIVTNICWIIASFIGSSGGVTSTQTALRRTSIHASPSANSTPTVGNHVSSSNNGGSSNDDILSSFNTSSAPSTSTTTATTTTAAAASSSVSTSSLSIVDVADILMSIPFTQLSLELLTLHKGDAKALLPVTWMVANASAAPSLVKLMIEQGIMPSLLRICLIHIRVPVVIKYVAYIVKALTTISFSSPPPPCGLPMIDNETIQTITLMYFTFLETVLPTYHNHKQVMKAVIVVFNNLLLSTISTLSNATTTTATLPLRPTSNTMNAFSLSALEILREGKTIEEKKKYLEWLLLSRKLLFPHIIDNDVEEMTLSVDEDKMWKELNQVILDLQLLC